MYFWRIEKLKAHMIQQPLTEREVLPYLLASSILLAVCLAVFRHLPVSGLWDDYSSAFNILLAAFGTYYIYLQNQGTHGEHILQRYIVLGWVVSIRWLVGFLLGSIILMIGLTIAGLSPLGESSQIINAIYEALASLVLYWLIGHHVRDVALKTQAAQPPKLPII